MTNEPNLADEFLSERNREPAAEGKYTTSLSAEVVAILDAWRGQSSRKAAAEKLIRIADQTLRARQADGGERGGPSTGALK